MAPASVIVDKRCRTKRDPAVLLSDPDAARCGTFLAALARNSTSEFCAAESIMIGASEGLRSKHHLLLVEALQRLSKDNLIFSRFVEIADSRFLFESALSVEIPRRLKAW